MEAISDEALSQLTATPEETLLELNYPDNNWGDLTEGTIITLSAYVLACMKKARKAQLETDIKSWQEEKVSFAQEILDRFYPRSCPDCERPLNWRDYIKPEEIVKFVKGE